MNIDNPYLLDILYSYYCVFNQGKIVNFCRIPCQNDKHGNNEAAKAAKSPLDFEIVQSKVPSTDLKQFINSI